MSESVPEGVEQLFGNVDKVTRYVDILATRGIEWGLLGPREMDRLWDRHVLNSAALVGLIPSGVHLVDVGSGAGLPGVPLALARPDLGITLLEPLQRRAEFLQLAVEELELTERVRVVRSRAEDHSDVYDVVTGRAVAPLTKWLVWGLPLADPDGGEVLILKGASAEQEVQRSRQALRAARVGAEVLQVRALTTSEPTTAVRIRRG